MPDIPRATQRFSSAEKQQFKRPKPQVNIPVPAVDTTEGDIMEAAGRALIGAGEIAGVLQTRKEKFEADKLTLQAAQVSKELQDEMTSYTAEVLTKTGMDAVGINEYNDHYEKSLAEITKRHKLEGTMVGDVVRYKSDKFSARQKESLANYQEKQHVTTATKHVSDIIEIKKTEARLSPESTDEIISEAISEINAVSDIIGTDAADAARKRAEIDIVSDMIMSEGQVDLNSAREHLSKYRNTMPKEAVKTIEDELKRIEKQTEEDLKKLREADAEADRSTMNQRLADGNPMTIAELENMRVPEKEKASYIKAALKSPTSFEETDQAVYADISTRLALKPESVTPDEIWSYVGKGKKGGLSTKDAQDLDKRRKDAAKGETAETPLQKLAYSALNNAKTSKLFSQTNPEINITEHAKQVRALNDYIKNHPDKDPVVYVDTILSPYREEDRRAITQMATDWVGITKGGPPQVVESPAERRLALKYLTDQGVDIENISAEKLEAQLLEANEIRTLAIQQLERQGYDVNPANIGAAMRLVSQAVKGNR